MVIQRFVGISSRFFSFSRTTERVDEIDGWKVRDPERAMIHRSQTVRKDEERSSSVSSTLFRLEASTYFYPGKILVSEERKRQTLNRFVNNAFLLPSCDSKECTRAKQRLSRNCSVEYSAHRVPFREAPSRGKKVIRIFNVSTQIEWKMLIENETRHGRLPWTAREDDQFS